MAFIASHIITSNEKEEIRMTFQNLDKNHDGLLSREELIEGKLIIKKNFLKLNKGFLKIFENDQEKAESEVDKILQMIGKKSEGKINYNGIYKSQIFFYKIN